MSALIEADTLAGDSVVSGRVDPAKFDDAPFLSVYTSDEIAITRGLQGVDVADFRSVLTLEVDARASGATLAEVEEDIETLIDQVRNGLLNSAAFLGTASTERLLHVDGFRVSTRFDGQAQGYVAQAVLQFDCAYLDGYEAS